MPKSRRISAYPPEYFKLFEKVVKDGTYLTPLMGEKQRNSLIFDLNGFRRALHYESHPQCREFDQVKVCKRGEGDESFVYFELNDKMVSLLGDLGPDETASPEFQVTSEFGSESESDFMQQTIADLFKDKDDD